MFVREITIEVPKYHGELKNEDVARPQKQQEVGTQRSSKIQLSPVGEFLARSLSSSVCGEYACCLKASSTFLIRKMRNMVARTPGFPSYHPGTQKKMNSSFSISMSVFPGRNLD